MRLLNIATCRTSCSKCLSGFAVGSSTSPPLPASHRAHQAMCSRGQPNHHGNSDHVYLTNTREVTPAWLTMRWPSPLCEHRSHYPPHPYLELHTQKLTFPCTSDDHYLPRSRACKIVMRLEVYSHPATAFSNVSLREHFVSDSQHTFSVFRQQIVDFSMDFVA